jgi:hypothetical protein
MAEPLSLMASIAGVATTSVAVSMSIYEMIRSLKTAPNEIKEMAKDLSILSAALRNLRRVMKDNDEVCTSRLKSDIKDALRHVSSQRNVQLGSARRNARACFQVSVKDHLVLVCIANHIIRPKEEVIAEIVDQRRLLENLVLSYGGSIGKLDQEENSGRPPRNLAFERYPQDRPGLQYSRQEPIILDARGNRWSEYGETKVPVGAGNAPFQQQTPRRRGQAGSARTAFVSVGRSRADLDKEVEHTDTGDENASDYSDAEVNGEDYSVLGSGTMAQGSAVPKPPEEPQGHEQEMSLILSRDVPVLFHPNARPQNEHSTNRPASPEKTTVPRDAEMMPRKHDPNDTATFLYEIVFGNRTSSNGAPPRNEMPPREGREPGEPRERPAAKPHRQARETAQEESRRVTNNLLLKWTSMSRESVMETAEQAALPSSSAEDREWLKEMLAICAEIRAFEERDERARGHRRYYHEFETDDQIWVRGNTTSECLMIQITNRDITRGRIDREILDDILVRTLPWTLLALAFDILDMRRQDMTRSMTRSLDLEGHMVRQSRMKGPRR